MKEKIESPDLYYVGGITGSGKTSISRDVSGATPETIVFHGSRLLMDYFASASYDDLDAISDDLQKRGRIEIFSNLKYLEARNILVDGHYVIFIRGGEPVSTVEREWISSFRALIHLTVNPEIILERLLKDSTQFPRRIKNLGGSNRSILDRITRSQQFSVEHAQNLSLNISIPLYIIDNSSTPDEAAKKLKTIIAENSR